MKLITVHSSARAMATGIMRKFLIGLGIIVLAGAPAATGAPQTCLECHGKTNPTMVAAWRDSRHAAEGVGCADCHGDNHSTIFDVKGQVSAAKCGTCHSREVNEFNRSLHAVAIDMMKADPQFGELSPVMADQSCNACHQIGAHFPDGSRGKCNSCHSSHSFSAAEARRPEACTTCHSGPDHAHMEMWQASKHGQLFAAEETRDQAPTCVTCHMPEGNHDTSVGLSFGNVASGAVLDSVQPAVKMRAISAAEAKRQRALMLNTCSACHSSRFASESLAKADRVKQEADAVIEEAAGVITELQKQKLIKWMWALPATGAAGSVGHSGALAPLLESGQPYEGLSPIEQSFFEMVKFHHATTFKGAYHHSPVHTHNKGYLPMKQALDTIKHHAEQLKTQAEGERTTK